MSQGKQNQDTKSINKELKEDFLKDIFGIYHDPKGYFVAHENPEDFEKYDLQFPKKEKLKLPGHIF